MYYLIAAIGGKIWWFFAKEGEITDWDELPILGKIGYKMFMFALRHTTGAKTDEEVGELMLQLMKEGK